MKVNGVQNNTGLSLYGGGNSSQIHFSKYLLLWSTEESKSYRFRNDTILIFGIRLLNTKWK